MKLKDIVRPLEEIAPVSLQEAYDNSGLQIGKADSEVDKILIALDVTEKVVEEALQNGCNLIISHHPLIFTGLKSITEKNYTERIVRKAIKNDLAVYAAHTNLDNAVSGVNEILGKKLGLINLRILNPKKELLRKLVTFCPTDHAEKVRHALFSSGAGHIGNYDSCSFNLPGTGSFRGLENSKPFTGDKGKLHYENEIRIETIYPVYYEDRILKALFSAHPYEEVAYDLYPLHNTFSRVGAGMMGELETSPDEIGFLRHLKEVTGARIIRHSELSGKKLKKIAICGGSGSFLIKEAIGAGANAYISGDIKYHDFFEAEKKILIADIGHYESEQFAKELIYDILIKNFPNFAVLISEINTNPINCL